MTELQITCTQKDYNLVVKMVERSLNDVSLKKEYIRSHVVDVPSYVRLTVEFVIPEHPEASEL